MLTEEQAYAAMVLFLQRYLQRGPSEDVADLLTGLQWMEEKGTADPAYWYDWEQVVAEIQQATVSSTSWKQWKEENLYLHFQSQ